MIKNEGIVLVSVEDIYPHPDNPRKNLGDLTELVASVKENGILQNLTVVPEHDETLGDIYTVLIGHRRLEAAEKAGLKAVPCAILEGLSREEQIGIMVTENIQREDLTILEEADALQMMMDLGMPIKTVAEKTGLSESTVRRRNKLLSLSREGVEKGMEQGATLFDFEKLFQVQNEVTRDELTALAGTKDFDWKLSSAIKKEKEEELYKKIEEVLESFAKKVDKCPEGYAWYSYIYGTEEGLEKVELLREEGKDVVYQTQYGLTLYIRKEEPTISPEEEQRRAEKAEEERKLKEFKNKVNEIGKQAYEKRFEFIKGFKASKVSLEDIIGFVIYAILNGEWVHEKELKELCGIEVDEENPLNTIKNISQSSRSLELLIKIAYSSLDDGAKVPYYYDGSYEEDSNLIPIYKALEGIGYKLASEEEDCLYGRLKVEE